MAPPTFHIIKATATVLYNSFFSKSVIFKQTTRRARRYTSEEKLLPFKEGVINLHFSSVGSGFFFAYLSLSLIDYFNLTKKLSSEVQFGRRR